MLKNWYASLNLKFKCKNEKTFLYRKDHKGPILVQKEFYPEKKICHVYIVHPPGGIVSGDVIDINITLKEFSKVLVTNPSSTKFYRSYRNNTSVIKQTFYLKEYSSLEWLPQSNIFFADAIINLENNFFIDKNAKLLAWDNFCFKPKNIGTNKVFGNGSFITSFQIWQDNVPLLNEKLRIIDGDLSILLEKYYFLSTIVAIPGNKYLLNLICNISYKNCIIGATLLGNLLIVKILNNNSINMHHIIYKIWCILRLNIIGVNVCKPRIWNT